MRLAIGGSQTFEVLIGGPGTPWENCPAGFTFDAGLSASASTGITVNGKWLANNCARADGSVSVGWGGGRVTFTGINASITANVTVKTHNLPGGWRFVLTQPWTIVDETIVFQGV